MRNQALAPALYFRKNGGGQNTVTLRTVLDSLERRQVIVGIYIDGSRSSEATGFATLKEVRAALSGSVPLVNYPGLQHELERTTLPEFGGKYHCAQPLGEMEIDGLSSQPCS